MPAPGVRTPFCVEEAERLARPASPGTGKRSGVQRVCRVFGVARWTAYFLKARQAVPPEQRPTPMKRGPSGAGSDADLVGHTRRVLAEVGLQAPLLLVDQLVLIRARAVDA